MKETKWWHVLLGIIIVLVIFIVGWISLSFLWNELREIFVGLKKEVAAALIAGVATVLVSVLSVILTKYYERKRKIEQEIREKKIPMYVEFVEFWFRVLYSKNITGKKIEEKEMIEFFSDFTQKVMVWGSDEVLILWSRYRRAFVDIEDPKSVSPEKLFDFEDLLMAIRKDMGHKNKGVIKGDLLGLFINDIDKYT